MDYVDANTCFGSAPGRRFDVSAQQLVEILKREGIGRAVTASLAGAYLGPEEGNAETLEACRRHSELLPAATADPRSYFGRDELVLRARRQGCVLLRLFNGLQGWPVDFAPVRVILQEARDAGMPVMLDAAARGEITRACRLAAEVGVTLIVSEIGYQGLSEIIVCMTEFPQVYAETSRIVTPDGLGVMCREVGSERLLFGTGAAVNYVGGPKLTLTGSGLGADDVRRIASRNVLELLGRP